jgi:hypothetical protein
MEQAGQDNDELLHDLDHGGTQAQAGEDNGGILVAMQAPAGHLVGYREQLNGVMALSHNGASQDDVNMALMGLSPAVQGVAIHNLDMYVCLHRPHALIVLRCREHNTCNRPELRQWHGPTSARGLCKNGKW